MYLTRQLQRKLVVAALFLLVILLFLQWLVPAAGLHFAKKWYSEQGTNYELFIKDWTFSPWRGLIELKGVHFEFAEQIAAFDKLSLNIAMLELPKRNLVIERAHFDGLKLSITQTKQGIEALGLSSAMLQTTQEGTTPDNQNDQAAVETQQASTPWTFSLKDIQLKNHLIAFSQSNLDLTLEVSHLSVAGDDPLNVIDINSALLVHALQSKEPLIGLDETLQVEVNGTIQQLVDSPTLNMDLILTNMNLANPWLPNAGFKRLTLSSVKLSQAQQDINQLSIDDIFIEDKLLSLKHYRAQDIVLNKNSLTTGVHQWDGLNTRLELDQHGGLAQLNLGSADVSSEGEGSEHAQIKDNTQQSAQQNAKASTDEKHNDDESTFKISVAEIKQNNQFPSSIQVVSPHVNPKLNLDITVNKLVVAKLNNQQEPIQLMLEAKTDDYSEIKLAANITTRDQINGDVQLNVDQFDLVSLNGYVAQTLGYHVEQGQLNLKTNINIDKGKLSGDADIFLRNSTLVPEDQATMDRISKQISMPIETALSLIKDDDNNMQMNIPIKGDVNAPDFGIDDLITQLTQKALTSATLHYVKQAIFPYGLLVSVADYVGEELFSISLTPIAMDQDELDEEQKKYLLKVVSLMQEKDSLQLRVCAQVDADTKDENWHDEALEKANKIKRYLVDQDETLSSRVSLCQPMLGNATQIMLGF